MARGKKTEKALTPEEKLEQALVPVEEQPYSVPENWCWVRLSAILAEIKNGTTIKQDKSGNGYFITRIESLQEQTIDFSRLGTVVNETDIREIDWYKENDIALSHINSIEHVGKTALITSNMLPLVHGMNLLRLRFTNSCYPKLFQFYSQSFQYKDAIVKRINMAVNQVSINQRQLGNLEFPLAPMPEQQRIVARIESLFAKLDEAKEKAQAVVDSFETRKAMILNKAFTGELTAEWRNTHKLRLEEWEETTVGNIVSLITKGASPRWQGINYTDDTSQTLFVTSENIREGYMSFEKEKYLDNKINEIQRRSILHYGDVLVNIVGASIGRVAIFDRNQLANVNQAVCIVRLKKDIDNQFICFYLNSPLAQIYYSENKVETARANISLSDIKTMPIKLPTIDEQLAIIQILQELFSKDQQAKETVEAVLGQIDTMKKAILARAFRGELGTNDPADESAVELLKKVV